MNCPPVKTLVEAVETGLLPDELSSHLGLCPACSDVIAALRDETEGLTISVGALWWRERVSCPHDDILAAHLNGQLGAEEADFISFHLETTECPHCNAAVGEIESALSGTGDDARLEKAKGDLLERSALLFDQER